MTSLEPLATGKTAARARRVFGDALLTGDSLTYSPSPSRPYHSEGKKAQSKPVLSSTMESSTITNKSLDTSSSIGKHKNEKDDVENHENSAERSNVDRSKLDSSLAISSSFDTECSDCDSVSSSKRRTPSAGPFDKLFFAEAEKADGQDESQEEKVTSVVASEPAITTEAAPSTELSKVRQLREKYGRSTVRRDLVQKTQNSISKKHTAVAATSSSINPSLRQARRAREINTRLKFRQTAAIRQEIQEETKEARDFYQKMGQQRFQTLQMERQLSSLGQKEHARRRAMQRRENLDQLDKESNFQSSVYRDHQRALKEDQDRRRRQSAEARTKLRQNARQGAATMKLQRIQEDQALYEERHESSAAMRAAAAKKAAQRRESFAFRHGDAHRIRQLHQQMEAQKRQEEAESHALAREADRDVDEHKQEMAKQRRESLAGRSAYARRQRVEEDNRMQEMKSKEHENFVFDWGAAMDVRNYQHQLAGERRESLAGRNQEAFAQRQQEDQRQADLRKAQSESYQLKHAGEKDAEEYRRQMAKERRDSLAFRNQEGLRQRQLLSQQQSERRMAEHESFALKWAGEKDAEAYQQEMAQERRNHLARRNKERVHHSQVMVELKRIAHQAETESLMLKWAGEKDAKEYLAKMEEERRKSLQQRGKQIVDGRQKEDELRAQALQQAQQDETLRSDDQRNVEAYRKECAERDRASLEYRRKEAHAQRLEEDERQRLKSQKDAENFELEMGAWHDVEEYVKSCKERRRLSLAFRAKEKRNHTEWNRRRQEEERKELGREVQGRMWDHRYAELARQEERAKAAMDAIRHANSTFNPFKSII